MAKMVIMGVMARPIMAVSLTFMDVPGKYAQNVDHQWKRFWKRFILWNFMAKTKKIEKKWPFSGDFLCIFVQNFKRVVLPQKLQENSEIFFGGLLGIDTALNKWAAISSKNFDFRDTLVVKASWISFR